MRYVVLSVLLLHAVSVADLAAQTHAPTLANEMTNAPSEGRLLVREQITTSVLHLYANPPHLAPSMRADWAPTTRTPRSRRRGVAIGALIGAVAGTGLLFASNNCRTPESMCGLSIPLYVGGGALIGGVAGYVATKARP